MIDSTIFSIDFQPIYSHLEKCYFVNTCVPITVVCSYPQDSTATGFQIIAQLSNARETNKIYTNRTTVCPRSLSILLEKNKTYQITVFAIKGERGILNSFGEYSMAITTSCENLPANAASMSKVK